ncbi:major facilitator family transporter [Streptomyces himastatinicus ATCC 53653]|uniref:Major facilitator family transporter n=1 Tax=Streptomyces himastatinicus ATCC 53653 TaxID=457427 RepID=D9WKY4_9ACTN|nr:MFS transporter [Streptomyces himastatinicus]EFL29259.1 major facilitator family transporter [Streptomyces himastatinicus ATCC 53653]
MSRNTSATVPAPAGLGRRLPLLMAVACGVTVANAYFPQAITPLIAQSFGVSPATAATLATLTQLGYAAGIFLLVPLGDRLPRRPLITVLLAVTSLALLAAGLAPATGLLLAAGTLVGLATVVPQILLPMAAGLVEPARRGSVIGTLQSGLIGGILLARTFSGVLGEQLGWRAPYLLAAVLTALLAVALGFVLPTTTPAVRDRYPALLADTLRMLRTEKELRRSVLFQVTVFGGFSAAWTAVALLITGPRYDMGTQAVGILALVGAGSMFFAPAAGAWVDRYGPDRVNLWCTVGGLAAAAVLAVGALGGIGGIIALAAGLLLIDVAVQCGQVANQSRIFALRAEFRSRLNTGYMTCSFLGGSVGSWLGARAFDRFGWVAVCALIALAVAASLAAILVGGRKRPDAADAPAAGLQPTASSSR